MSNSIDKGELVAYLEREKKYEIQDILGEGGMSTVYLGYQKALDRKVALKVILEKLTREGDFVARFQKEAKLLAQLDHPNIVKIYDYIEHENLYCLVMEYVEGDTLLEILERLHNTGEIMTIFEASYIALALCGALEHAHSRHVVHRDIKPSNIIFKRKDSALIIKLTDFGIAKLVRTTIHTLTSGFTGTPLYMSPEQFTGDVDSRSDIYSLGVLLYEMTTGHVPFRSDDLIVLYHKHVNETPPSPRTYNANLPISYEDIILKATQKSPADRYQSIGELKQDLERALYKLQLSSKQKTSVVTIPSLQTQTGEKFEFTSESILVGRGKFQGVKADIDLTDVDAEATVSRRHARIFRQDDCFYIQDLGSLNGVIINGVELEPDARQQLNHNDVIELGDVKLTFTC